MAQPLPQIDVEQHSLLRANPSRRFFTPKEVADVADMSVSWVYQEINAGRIPHRMMGGRIKIPRKAVEELDLKLRSDSESNS